MTNFAPAAPRQRPSSVTNAGILMYVIGGILLIQIAISAATASKIINAAGNVQDVNGTNLKSVESAGVYAGIGVDVLLAIVFIILGALVVRGSNGIRITTWVFAGLAILCSFCGLVGTSVSGSLTKSSTTTNQAQVQAIRDAQPGWAKASSIGLSVLMLIAAVLVVILLARRASNDYFRKADLAAPGYPAYPGNQAVNPGYPTYPSVPETPPADQPWSNPGGDPPTTP